ncbi:MAG TPA: hypothetical protein VLI04_05405 [Nocardioidaceae bacterium]|nr:hypothetical protein [Nocardioidaceae bacterium]
MSRRDAAALLGCIATLSAVIVAIRLAFPSHPDYMGHFSAGAGATMAFLVTVVAFTQWTPHLVAGLLLLCVGMGVGTEATIFRLAAFDRMDFALQSAGAALAAMVLLTMGTPLRNALAFLAGMGFLFLGFILVFGVAGA